MHIEKETLVSSSSLFHYTKKLDFLTDIIENGFKISNSLETFYTAVFGIEVLQDIARTFYRDSPEKIPEIEQIELAIPVVCFCDTPLNLASVHSEMYGKFAIGLNKDWGIRELMNPILYLSKRSEVQRLIDEFHKMNPEANSDANCDKLRTIISNLLFYTKPYVGDYNHNSETYKNYKYYDEREWRYIPNIFETGKLYLKKEEYLKQKTAVSGPLFVEKTSRKFDKKDITHFICPESDKENLKKKVKQKFNVNDSYFESRYHCI